MTLQKNPLQIQPAAQSSLFSVFIEASGINVFFFLQWSKNYVCITRTNDQQRIVVGL